MISRMSLWHGTYDWWHAAHIMIARWSNWATLMEHEQSNIMCDNKMPCLSCIIYNKSFWYALDHCALRILMRTVFIDNIKICYPCLIISLSFIWYVDNLCWVYIMFASMLSSPYLQCKRNVFTDKLNTYCFFLPFLSPFYYMSIFMDNLW